MQREIDRLVRNQILSLGLVPAIAETCGVSESLVQSWLSPSRVNALPLWAGEAIVELIRAEGGLDPILPRMKAAADRGEARRAQEPLRFPPHEVGRAG